MATRTRKKTDNTTSEVVGAVAGAFAGKAVADVVDPAEEEKYWEENYTTRPYYKEGAKFVEYQPAYQYGLTAATTTRARASPRWSRA